MINKHKKLIYGGVFLCLLGFLPNMCSRIFDHKDPEKYPRYEDSVSVAIEQEDFVKAHKFAERCNERFEEKEKVIKAEAVYVMEHEGEEGLPRIEMIVNEYAGHYSHSNPIYSDLSDIAMIMGKESLAKQFIILSLPKLEGTRPLAGLRNYWGDYYSYEHKKYVESVNNKNTACMHAINKAIELRDKQFANEIIKLIVQDVEVTRGESDKIIKVNGVKVDYDHVYIKYTYESRNAAKQILKEAEKEGSFN